MWHKEHSFAILPVLVLSVDISPLVFRQYYSSNMLSYNILKYFHLLDVIGKFKTDADINFMFLINTSIDF